MTSLGRAVTFYIILSTCVVFKISAIVCSILILMTQIDTIITHDVPGKLLRKCFAPAARRFRKH
jgi:hypothetical protein